MHTVFYGEGEQSLEHVPPERVTSATFTVEDLLYDVEDTANRVLATGDANPDDLDLTTDAVAGPSRSNPRVVPCEDTTGASAGDPVVIVAPGGTFEAARIRGVVTDDYLVLEHPLMGEYPIGSKVYGTALTATVPAATANDEDLMIQERELRVVWEYTIAGRLRKVQEPVWVRRMRTGSAYEMRAVERFRQAYPDLSEKTPSPDSLANWAAFCVEDLRARLLARSIEPGQFLTGEQGVHALTYRMVMHAAEHGLAPGTMNPDSFLELAQQHFDAAFGSLTTGEVARGVVELSLDTEQAVARDELRSPWGDA